MWRKTLGFLLFALGRSVHLLLGIGATCRFEPTCSQYAKQALEEKGIFRGLFLTVKRLVRCHPWGPWGIDTVSLKEETWRRAHG
jgi:uncharacterized protein